jgi:hypothetical protein
MHTTTSSHVNFHGSIPYIRQSPNNIPCWLMPCPIFARKLFQLKIHFMKTRNIFVLFLSLAYLFPAISFAQAPNEKPLRDFQLSIIPYFGTEGRNAANYRYNFSLNLFAGVTGGLEGIEAGGFMNINTGSVKGAQFAGFGNLVHGDMEGFQGSGFMNLIHGNTRAFHGAGFINFISGSTEGFHSAGFINVFGGSSRSFTAAGFANVTGGHFEGFLGSGFANVTGGNVKGFQGAGFANVTGGRFEGFQGAGFANVTGNDSKGVHAAGFMNINRDFKGAQIAGFLNAARKVEGVQIGFLNIADTVDGVPIGFLSIVKKGAYRQIEVSGSDVMHLGASFRIGVPAFYNIFSYGTRPFASETVHGFGYGIGTSISFSQYTGMQIEGHSTQLRQDWKWDDEHLDMLNELRITMGIRLAGRIELFAGPVLYNHIYKYQPENGIYGSDLTSYTLDEKRWDDYVSKWWIGARGGLRFRLD